MDSHIRERAEAILVAAECKGVYVRELRSIANKASQSPSRDRYWTARCQYVTYSACLNDMVVQGASIPKLGVLHDATLRLRRLMFSADTELCATI